MSSLESSITVSLINTASTLSLNETNGNSQACASNNEISVLAPTENPKKDLKESKEKQEEQFLLQFEEKDDFERFQLACSLKYGIAMEKNELLAVNYFEISSRKGFLYAIYELSLCYQEGIGVSKDEKIAKELLTEVNKKEYVEVLLHLAELYWDGKIVEDNKQRAIDLWQMCADLDSGLAFFELGNIHSNGYYVKKDEERGAFLYQTALDKGYLPACLELTIYRIRKLNESYYASGKIKSNTETPKKMAGTLKNFLETTKDLTLYRKLCICVSYASFLREVLMKDSQNQAFLMFKDLAEQGFPRAQALLGECYEKGLGVEEPNIQTAIEWYKRASEADDLLGLRFLGKCYFAGKGMRYDIRKAAECFKRAIQRGDTTSSSPALALCYLFGGYNFERDPEKARKILEDEISKNNAKAMFILSQYYSSYFKETQDQKKRDEWIHRAAEAGWINAKILLASHIPKFDTPRVEERFKLYFRYCEINTHAMFELAQHFNDAEDYERALEYYHKADKLGNIDATEILASFYSVGFHVKQDKMLARTLYEKCLLTFKYTDSKLVLMAAANLYDETEEETFNPIKSYEKNLAWLQSLYTPLKQNTYPIAANENYSDSCISKLKHLKEFFKVQKEVACSIPVFSMPVVNLIIQYGIGKPTYNFGAPIKYNYKEKIASTHSFEESLEALGIRRSF